MLIIGERFTIFQNEDPSFSKKKWENEEFSRCALRVY